MEKESAGIEQTGNGKSSGEEEDDSLTNLLPIEQKVMCSGSITNIDEHVYIPSPQKKKHKTKTQNEEKTNDSDVIEYIDKEIQRAAIPEERSGRCGCSEDMFKIFIGLLLVIFISISWTASTQFGKSTYSVNFKAPFFTTWLTTSFMLIIFPLFMIPLTCKKKAWRLRTFLSQSARLFGPRGFCVQSLLLFVFRITLPFCLTWLLTNYLYFRALEKLLPGVVTAVFSSSSCFVYILSLLLLKDTFFIIRLLAVIISIGGIVLIGYSEGFGNSNTIGIVFASLAACGSATYQVMFKRVMGSPSGSQVALFLSFLGFVNIFLFWPLLLVLDYYEYETLNWSELPWKYLIGIGVMGTVFNYAVNFGIAYTFPLFISIGILVGVPMSTIVDVIFRSNTFDWIKVIGIVLVLVGFVLMLIPNEKLETIERRTKVEEVNSDVNKV